MIPRPAVFEEAKMTIESEGNDSQEKDALKLSVVSTPLVLNTPLNKENEERREEAVSNLQSGDENFSESDSEDEDEEFFDVDETEFVHNVDDYNGDCFVLHIKQLTQGIDVKTLTDCIYYNSSHLNDGTKRTILQTIGRTLRPLKGERGKRKDERLKKIR